MGSPVARGALLVHLLAVVVVVALEIWFYPVVSTATDGLLGGEGGPGSSIGYFRDHYVFPAGIVFAALAIASLGLAARRGRGFFHRVAVGLWLLNLAAIFASSIWYFHTIRAAGGYRG